MARRARRILRAAALTIGAVLSVGTLGCLRVSNGTWYIKSASVPEGWPELTPIGQVEIKTYPEYREATVSGDTLSETGMQPMFMSLFQHIKKNDIPMTAPVDMGYDPSDARQMRSMAFLYRVPTIGSTGEDGPVLVRDVSARSLASVGVRGGYTSRTYERGLLILNAWLAESEEWRSDGPPRFLGYNGPFVPVFWRYGEVQIPVAPR